MESGVSDPCLLLESCMAAYKAEFGARQKYSEYFIVPLLFSKEFQTNKDFYEHVIKRSHRKMDDSRFSKTVDCLDNYSLKKLKKILNYPHFYSLLETYNEYITEGLYETSSANDKYKTRILQLL